MINFSEKERCEVLGRYIVENGATVRATAGRFQISKSTVHKDVTSVLRHVNYALFLAVEEILQKNKMERHLRGGEATRQKYKRKTSSAKKREGEGPF